MPQHQYNAPDTPQPSCTGCGVIIDSEEERGPLGPMYCTLCDETLKIATMKEPAANKIDLATTDLKQLHSLSKRIDAMKKFQVRLTAHKLLMTELGEQYESFIAKRQVEVKGSNGNRFIIHLNGRVQVYQEDKEILSGQLYRNGYPAQDALVTFLKYAKHNADRLQQLWGCGNIKLQGGEIEID